MQIRAEQFDVSLPFLLQQAAWLYERQLSQVRAQLRKVSKPASTGTSPTLGSIAGSTTAGGQAMKRGGSGGNLMIASFLLLVILNNCQVHESLLPYQCVRGRVRF